MSLHRFISPRTGLPALVLALAGLTIAFPAGWRQASAVEARQVDDSDRGKAVRDTARVRKTKSQGPTKSGRAETADPQTSLKRRAEKLELIKRDQAGFLMQAIGGKTGRVSEGSKIDDRDGAASPRDTLVVADDKQARPTSVGRDDRVDTKALEDRRQRKIELINSDKK